MQIKLKYFNMLREAVGIREEYFEFSEIPTIQHVIDNSCAKYGDDLINHLYNRDRQLKPSILIFLDNKIVDHSELDQVLNDGDEIYLFPLISGG